MSCLVNQSYSPIEISGGSASSVGLVHSCGAVGVGGYIENVAFNPSLPPLQVALVALITQHHIREWMGVEEVVVMEDRRAKVLQKDVVEAVARTLMPKAKFGIWGRERERKELEFFFLWFTFHLSFIISCIVSPRFSFIPISIPHNF